ncbi:hypothetical protein [Xanthocytophaga agilis]|uniref:Uncharacterized protein n=1 Tax=Xanthocytophaga agilis TaxID=3048010 RepID=A0AAE3RBA5_9BACT|nr:hypothetical protein [Xanthocytophaga agilis]MDJ1505015.1 hypothetical protein [Xanthocytophaga agilis]
MKFPKLLSFFQRRKKLESRLESVETAQVVLLNQAIMQQQVNIHQQALNKVSLKSNMLTLITLVLLLGLVAYLLFKKPVRPIFLETL